MQLRGECVFVCVFREEVGGTIPEGRLEHGQAIILTVSQSPFERPEQTLVDPDSDPWQRGRRQRLLWDGVRTVSRCHIAPAVLQRCPRNPLVKGQNGARWACNSVRSLSAGD